MTKLLFIGAGRMAEAIVAGLLHKDPDFRERITVSNQRDEKKLLAMENKYGIETSQNWAQHVESSDVVVLAMPPEAHDEVLSELGLLTDGQLVVTVAAGIGVKKLQDALPAGTPVAWVMPNTAADLGQSMSLFTCGEHVTAEHRVLLAAVLEAIGEAEECTEAQIHELTAITGSAPAFVYRMAEILEEAAMEYGVERAKARKLVAQMISGAGAMLASGADPAELREQVTTPGGATAAGLELLAGQGYRQMIKQAVEAVNARAEEQAREDE